jgi:hypothetical protein
MMGDTQHPSYIKNVRKALSRSNLVIKFLPILHVGLGARS